MHVHTYTLISSLLHTHVQEIIANVSKDKHGSRVMDSVWRNCEINRKDELAEVLLACEEQLAEDFYGKIVLRNCNIAHYKRKQESWREQEKAAEKKRTLFEDIISDSTLPKKKRKLVE